MPQIQPVSSTLRALFLPIAKHNLRKSFRAVRLSNAARLRKEDAPLVVTLNHASWWDPLACFFVATSVMPERDHYAPMETGALDRFPFFRRLGIFPLDPGTPRGAAHFLRTAQQIVLDRKNVLWLTPQGRFADARLRPAGFANGIGALLARKRELTLQPLALEYVFWNQRLPELLINIGKPLFVTPSDRHTTQEWTALAEAATLAAQDELKDLALRRDPAHFETLLEGTAGTGGVYGIVQRLRGKHLSADHPGGPAKTPTSK
jgi:1-acyl-sn-glycerol-3-phosphate acyltransferase